MDGSGNPNAAIDSPRAWVVVVGTFSALFVGFGVTYSFGVFLRPMATAFGTGHALMSVLFSVLTVLSYSLAPLTGELADRIGPRPVVGAGGLLMGAGLLLTARAQSFAVLFLGYGMLLGASMACVYIPSVAAVGEWFKARRDLALGIAISGIGCGTLVAPPLAAHLSSRLGWRGAIEVFGWASMALLLAFAALLQRPPVLRAREKINVSAKVRTRTFALLYLGLTFRGIAVYVAFVYLPAFASDIGVSQVAGAALIGYLGGASIAGRLGLNALAPRLGLLNTYSASYVLVLAGCVLWLLSHSYATLIGFALIMGVGYGGIAAMTPAVVAARFGVEGLGKMLGLLYTSFGVACVVGPPLAGVLVDITHDYKWPVWVAAAGALAAVGAVIPLRAGERGVSAEAAVVTAD